MPAFGHPVWGPPISGDRPPKGEPSRDTWRFALKTRSPTNGTRTLGEFNQGLALREAFPECGTTAAHENRLLSVWYPTVRTCQASYGRGSAKIFGKV